MLKFDSSGLTIDTLAEIIQQIKDDLRAPENFGPEFNPDDDNPLMVHVSRYAIREESLQRGLVEDYNAIDIDQANGVALDNLATLGGSKRAKETFSTVAGLAGGIEGTDVSSKLIRFNVSGELWRLPPNQTIPVGGTLPVIVTAVNPGPVNAFASDDWSIINVTPGFKTFISIADAIRGALAASNNAFRAQYRKELASRGKATAPAVVANLSQNTPGVTNVTIFPNRTNIVDENGVAPHGMELLFEGGTDEDIRQGILENIDISSETSGDISGNVSVNGIEYTLRHSRTDLVPIAISVVLFVHIAMRTHCQGTCDGVAAEITRQNEHAQVVTLLQQLARQRNAVAIGQADVEHHNVWLLVRDNPPRLSERAGLSDQTEIAFECKQHAQAIANQRMILNNHHTGGRHGVASRASIHRHESLRAASPSLR